MPSVPGAGREARPVGPADKLILQFLPALIPAPSSSVILLPAVRVSDAFGSWLAGKFHRVAISMFLVAARLIWDKAPWLTRSLNEFTLRVSVSGLPALGGSPGWTMPEPGALSPWLLKRIFPGSMKSFPLVKPAAARPSIPEWMALIWDAEISTWPPLPPREPPATSIVDPV